MLNFPGLTLHCMWTMLIVALCYWTSLPVLVILLFILALWFVLQCFTYVNNFVVPPHCFVNVVIFIILTFLIICFRNFLYGEVCYNWHKLNNFFKNILYGEVCYNWHKYNEERLLPVTSVILKNLLCFPKIFCGSPW